jgi:hypothetical protein
MEALPEELLQSGWHHRAQPSVPLRDNPDYGPPGTPVHEFLERLSGSLPPMASAKAGANYLVQSAGNYRAAVPKRFASGQGPSHSSRERSKM